jgi:cysteinyl-tRNA synthetase
MCVLGGRPNPFWAGPLRRARRHRGRTNVSIGLRRPIGGVRARRINYSRDSSNAQYFGPRKPAGKMAYFLRERADVADTRPIYFTNTMGHRRERFEAINPPVVLMYTCGPTVYSYAHIGNFRSFLMADIVRRVLEYNRYEVIHARNITDVGHLTNETLNTGLDRIEKAAREQHRTPQDIADHFAAIFLTDARRLNLLEPAFAPRASAYIIPMIELTQELIDTEHAYQANGDVYFDVATFPSYGALSGNSVDDLVAGARVEVGVGKRSPADFALWRGAGPDKLVRFDSPWGPGVPGWHIECSAMSRELLAPQLDIHTGGADNIFPHHEDERAQSEAASGTTFVRYWLHSEWLQATGDEKMSKSAGNIFTVDDLVRQGIHPLSYRYFIFQAHYRTPQNFVWDALSGAQTALFRLWTAAAELVQSGEPRSVGTNASVYRERFHEAINDDLNLPVAVAGIHDMLGDRLGPGEKLALLEDFDRVLGLDILDMACRLSEISPDERDLLSRREAARASRDWAESDRLRDTLFAHGLAVRDTPEGQRWARTDLLTGVGEALG